ncbi:MAG: hypothetical protein ACLFMX_08025 [Halobacteriales archaeon]
MHSAILYVLAGEPDREELPSTLDGWPAADIEATAYLDGRRIHHGTVAGRVEVEQRVPVIGEDFITDEREPVTEKVMADVYADLETGWGGISTSAAEDVFVDYLAATAGVIPEAAVLDLVGFAESLSEDATVNGVVYSQSIEDGHDRDAAGAQWHQDADRHSLPTEGFSALAVTYEWDGSYVDAMLAASGYVALYKDWPADQWARWVADEIEPYLEQDRDEQEVLG